MLGSRNHVLVLTFDRPQLLVTIGVSVLVLHALSELLIPLLVVTNFSSVSNPSYRSISNSVLVHLVSAIEPFVPKHGNNEVLGNGSQQFLVGSENGEVVVIVGVDCSLDILDSVDHLQ